MTTGATHALISGLDHTDRNDSNIEQYDSAQAHDQDPGAEVYTCLQCSKQYVRLCDLNKHSKTHSRPHKCPVQDCKYHEYGWPTEKELERHNNDKHSLSPRTYSCREPGCTYRSKRESNCKQHMEKAHRITYIRSRSSKVYRCPYHGCYDCMSPGDTQERHAANHAREDGATSTTPATSVQPWDDHLARIHVHAHADAHPGTHPTVDMTPPNRHFSSVPAFDQDFTLFDMSEHAFLQPDDIVPVMPQGTPLGTPQYMGWGGSPDTRVDKMQTYLHSFDKTYAGDIGKVRGGKTPLMIDPNIDGVPFTSATLNLHPALSPADTIIKGPRSEASFVPITAPQYYPPNSQCMGSAVAQTGSVAPLGLAGDASPRTTVQTTTKRRFEAVSRGGGGDDPDEPDDSSLDGEGDEDEEDDGDDEDDEPRRKKPKFSPDGEFDDTQMPCPFRLAFPKIYQRDTDSKYGACHTKHEQVSTIVRHLKRPAHRLAVEDLFVHSFDVKPESNVLHHPPAGLCRKCWASFDDRDQFDRHIAGNCARKSRSKREKFQALRNTFCAVASDDSAQAAAEIAIGQGGQARQPDATGQRPDPRPQAATPAPRAASLGGDGQIPLSNDFLALAERVKVLEESNNMLKMLASMTLLLLAQHQHQQRRQGQSPRPLASATSGSSHDQSHERRVGQPRPGLSRVQSAAFSMRTRSSTTTDHQDLVGVMERNSSVNVDHEALMDECDDMIIESERINSGPASQTDQRTDAEDRASQQRPLILRDVDAASLPAGGATDGDGQHGGAAQAHGSTTAALSRKRNVPESDSGFASEGTRRFSGAHEYVDEPCDIGPGVVESSTAAAATKQAETQQGHDPQEGKQLWQTQSDSQGSQQIQESHFSNAIFGIDSGTEFMDVD